MGNLPEDERALTAAQSLNPGDPWSRYMLAFLNSVRRNTNVADQIYAPLQQMAPNLMPIPSAAPQPGASAQPETRIAILVARVFTAILPILAVRAGTIVAPSWQRRIMRAELPS